MKKIGMCCACGGTFSTKDTVIVDGMELCKQCAAAVGREEGYDERGRD